MQRNALLTPDVGIGLTAGRKRRRNEDSVAAVNMHYGAKQQTPIGFYMVADGIGGSQLGDLASQSAVQTAIQFLVERSTASVTSTSTPDGQWLQDAFVKAKDAVQKIQEEHNGSAGTTLVASIIFGNQVYIASIGDSRAYRLQEGKLQQITKDDTHAQFLVDIGELSPTKAAENRLNNVLLDYVGNEEMALPEVYDFSFADTDGILLCSDGLFKETSIHKIETFLRDATSAQAACDALIQFAERDGHSDDIAIVFVRMH